MRSFRAVASIRSHSKSSIDELSEDKRLAVFNAQEEVVAVMNDAEMDKVECRKQHQMGSHMPKLVCQTKRERLAATEQSRKEMRRLDACRGPNCRGGY